MVPYRDYFCRCFISAGVLFLRISAVFKQRGHYNSRILQLALFIFAPIMQPLTRRIIFTDISAGGQGGGGGGGGLTGGVDPM